MKQILKDRTLLIIGAAEMVSGIGDWITMMAVLAMLVFRGDGGVMSSSGIFLAGLLPTLFSSPVAGWLVDRVNRRTLLIGSQLLAGVVVSGLFFTTRIELIYILLAVEAVILSVVTPTRQAVIPDLVSREDLPRANAFLQQLAGLVKVFSPVIAGMVLSIMDPHTAILFDVASFFLAAIVLMFLPSLPAHGTETTHEKSKLAESPINVLQTIPQLQILFTGVFVAILTIIGFDVLSSIYTRDVLHQGEKLYGMAISLVGIGSLVATTIVMFRKTGANPWIDIVLGFGFLTIIPLALVVSYQFDNLLAAQYLLLFACLIGGLGNGLVHVQIGRIMQLVTPTHILGQVSGWLQMVMVAGQLVGLLLTPFLVPGLVNMEHFFAGMVGMMCILIIFLSIQIFRKNGLKQEIPSAEF